MQEAALNWLCSRDCILITKHYDTADKPVVGPAASAVAAPAVAEAVVVVETSSAVVEPCVVWVVVRPSVVGVAYEVMACVAVAVGVEGGV